MNERKRVVRVRRRKAVGKQDYIPLDMIKAYVDAQVQEQIKGYTERVESMEKALHTIAIILADFRNSAQNASISSGSMRVRFDQLCLDLTTALANHELLGEDLSEMSQWVQRQILGEGPSTESLGDDIVEALSEEDSPYDGYDEAGPLVEAEDYSGRPSVAVGSGTRRGDR